MSVYPAYVQQHGNVSSQVQPFACGRSQMYGFFVRGDAATMQRSLIDPCLNQPTGGALHYQALFDQALVTFAYSGRITGESPIDDAIGWTTERSATVWIPTAAVKKTLGVWVAERLAMFIGYIVVDSGWSMASGREVYGFPKQLGTIVMPTGPAAPSTMQASTMVFEKFAPDEEARIVPVMTVEAKGAPAPSPSTWATVEEAARAIVSRLAHPDGTIVVPGLGFVADLVKLAVTRTVPCVFLKQFRDVADGTRACYQAVVEAPVTVTRLTGGGFLPAELTFTTVDFATHPIVRDLGLPAPTVAAEAPFYVDLEYVAENGRELWKA